MLACNCRRIRENDVVDYLEKNPHMLGKTWAIVSTKISGSEPVCKDGQGVCTESATMLMELCSQGAPSLALNN